MQNLGVGERRSLRGNLYQCLSWNQEYTFRATISSCCSLVCCMQWLQSFDSSCFKPRDVFRNALNVLQPFMRVQCMGLHYNQSRANLLNVTSVNSAFLLPGVRPHSSAFHNSVLLARVDVALAVIFISLILAKHSESLLSNIYSRNFAQLIHCFPAWSNSLLEERDIFLLSSTSFPSPLFFPLQIK